MASNHTTHYDLSQWQATDEVVRTDFNADNAKIDAALHGKLGRSQLLQTVKSGASGIMSADMRQMDWSKWEEIHVQLLVPSSFSESDSFVISFNNTSAGGTSSMDRGRFGITPAYNFHLILYPRHDPSATVTGILLGDASGFCVARITFAEMQDLVIGRTASGYGMPGGLTLTVWGIG